MSDLQTMAQKFGVSERDLNSFAQSVIESMKKDGIIEAFKSMDEKTRTEVAAAYGINAVRKMQQFTNTYFSDPRAAAGFRATVKGLL